MITSLDSFVSSIEHHHRQLIRLAEELRSQLPKSGKEYTHYEENLDDVCAFLYEGELCEALLLCEALSKKVDQGKDFWGKV